MKKSYIKNLFKDYPDKIEDTSDILTLKYEESDINDFKLNGYPN